MRELLLILVGVALTIIAQRGYRYGILGMWIQSWRKTNRKPEPERYSGHEKYGHPYPPVPYLVDKLPKPPTGTAWEVVTTAGNRLHNSNKEPTIWLVLRLIHLLEANPANRILDSKLADLIWYGGGTHAWRAEYRDAVRCGSSCERIFNNYLITPLVDWAQRQVDSRPDIPQHSDEYMMKGA